MADSFFLCTSRTALLLLGGLPGIPAAGKLADLNWMALT